MSRKRKELGQMMNVPIVDINSKGKAVGKSEDLVLFVDNAVPGDVADIQITKKKKNYAQGRVIKIQKESKDRVDAFCKHFGICGGCKWQDLDYQAQLKYKEGWIVQNFKKIGGIEVPDILPILGSANTKHYRNKLEFTFTNKKWLTQSQMEHLKADTLPEDHEQNGLGLHLPGKFDKVMDLEECFLQREPSNKIRLAIRDFALEHGLSFFDIREQRGLLRTLIIRTASTGDLMVLLSFFKNDTNNINALLEHLSSEFPEITSLMYVVNSKKNDTITDLKIRPYVGKDHIIEEIDGLKFKVGPKTFFQTNSEQAAELYKIVADFAQIKKKEVVYDLYTGSGTIANYLAKSAKKVVGLEYVPESIENAKENAALNGIDNTTFYAGDMKDLLTDEFVEENGTPDVIVTDPPRSGMHADVVKKIAEMQPNRIVYVSCDSATQARDVALLDQYKVAKMQPVDMFPHTSHVENVALLVKI
ncbi:MAG: 23S rRNA (uracil(1939)-C(5))-methyltransferase RlmD [Flavobacteriales bacterium]|nr:23S rRNA (uracil(1939)-C(5))-methyltransferase RlmD [Flavobacteriales bacterium]